jgi:hypothetical protein
VSMAVGTFLKVYASNREMADEVVLDGDHLAALVRGLDHWEGTATELLGLLNLQVSEEVKRHKSWYEQGRQISNSLRRLAPTLRRVGTEVILDPKNRRPHSGDRLIVIRKMPPAASPASPGRKTGPIRVTHWVTERRMRQRLRHPTHVKHRMRTAMVTEVTRVTHADPSSLVRTKPAVCLQRPWLSLTRRAGDESSTGPLEPAADAQPRARTRGP